jgi:hypothetical protein
MVVLLVQSSYGLGFFGMKILPLSFLGRFRGGCLGLLVFTDDEDA